MAELCHGVVHMIIHVKHMGLLIARIQKASILLNTSFIDKEVEKD